MIIVNDLSFQYPGSPVQAARDLNFRIEPGEIFGFLGPSGAGKSTTQKILIGLLKGYGGEISIMGKSLVDWDPDFYNHVGVGFELPNHYLKLSAMENLRFFGSFYSGNKDYDGLLDRVGLLQDADKKVENYSKGMKVRLNFIRALLHDPQILFLDEPTSGLDPVNARKIKDIILEQKAGGKTIFITTHNMHDADELCDRISFIVEGELLITETPKQLKLDHGTHRVRVEYADASQNAKVEEFLLMDLGKNQKFFDLLKSRDIISIHSQEASLDEVFIKITGKNLI
ncbi:ATP-binding cassette domain-containing protein [Bacteroidota bacterium]